MGGTITLPCDWYGTTWRKTWLPKLPIFLKNRLFLCMGIIVRMSSPKSETTSKISIASGKNNCTLFFAASMEIAALGEK